jgi:hypothetical protein
MKGDFSRASVEGRQHYVGVLHQQGRVWLDSDWNADALARLDVARKLSRDFVGTAGVPDPGSAFGISPNPDGTAQPDDFLIAGGEGAAGRCYVQGMLCQLDASTSYLSQPDLPNPPRIAMPTSRTADVNAVVYLEVWQRLITYLEDDTLREVALGGPDTAARLKTVAQVRVAVIPSSVPVADISCETATAFLPRPGSGTLTTLQPRDPLPEDLCRLPDPSLFTGRENHLYRVEIHDGGDVAGSAGGLTVNARIGQDASAGARTLVLTAALSAAQMDAVRRWGTLTLVDDTGRSQRVVIAGISGNGTTLTLDRPLPEAFTTARGATVVGVARFKWSRDNAASAVRVSAVAADRRTLTLESLGRDKATALRQGDLVEISDDASELGPARGHLTFLIADPDPDQFTVAIADDLPTTFAADGSGHLVLRRWDGQGTAKSTFGETTTPDMNLGDGVHVQFGGSDLRSGDYWQFTARSVDGSVETLTDAPPAGIVRVRSPLAIVRWSLGAGTPASPSGLTFRVMQDCRNVFSPLSDLPRAEPGMRVIGVVTIAPGGQQVFPLVNDSDVLVTDLLTGIAVQCDADVEPATISSATCSVTVELPAQVPSLIPSAPPLLMYQPMVLAGDVGVNANAIIWRPRADTAAALPGLPLLKLATDRGVLARLTLRGNFIWARNDPSLFLDGEAFGFPRAGTITTSLGLPSGDRRRGGVFESWFWIIARPVVLSGVSLNVSQILVGDAATGTVTISDVAPPGGFAVTITLSNPNAGQVAPATVTIPAGSSSATFVVTGTAAGAITVTASAGGVSLTTPLTVAERPIVLTSFTLSPTVVLTGIAATGTVTLSRAAAPPGVAVTLTSSAAGVVTGLPASLTISGSATGTFTVTGQTPGATTIQAVLGAARTATLTVNPRKTKDTKEGKEKEVKEGKEGKELKERGKEGFAKERDVEFTRPLATPEPVRPARPARAQRKPRSAAKQSGGSRRTARRSSDPPAGQRPTGERATRRAFIRPDERPRLV